MADIKFEIKKYLGVIGEGTKGWKKEVNLVSWNDRSQSWILGIGMKTMKRWVKE